MTGKEEPVHQDGPDTGEAANHKTWDDFWEAYARQTEYIVQKSVAVYEMSESLRANVFPHPLSVVSGEGLRGKRGWMSPAGVRKSISQPLKPLPMQRRWTPSWPSNTSSLMGKNAPWPNLWGP